MRTATEGNPPPVMPQANLVEVLGREVRQGLPGELMVESSPSRQRWPSCKTSKEMSDEAADTAALLTYLLTCVAPWFVYQETRRAVFWILFLVIFSREVGCNAFSDLTHYFLTVGLASWKWL